MTELQAGDAAASPTGEQAPVRTPAGAGSRGGKGGRGRRAGKGGPSRNPVVRTRRFSREVVAELRKVIYPSRSELITYVSVVLVFVTAMVAFVAGLDYGFTKAVLAVFG